MKYCDISADGGRSWTSQWLFAEDVMNELSQRHIVKKHGDVFMHPMDTLENRDQILAGLWNDFTDVPMDPETECIEESFLGFAVGTHREEIWHWFDDRHSKGVAFLLYGDGTDRTDELAKLQVRNLLCEECDADCVYNPEGICRYPLVYGKKPKIVDDYGCKVCFPSSLGEEDV